MSQRLAVESKVGSLFAQQHERLDAHYIARLDVTLLEIIPRPHVQYQRTPALLQVLMQRVWEERCRQLPLLGRHLRNQRRARWSVER